METETQPENTDAALRALAAQADTERWDGDTVVEPVESAPTQDKTKPEGSVSPEAKTEVTQESQDPSPPVDDQAAGIKDARSDIDYRSEYERLKKETERQDRSWKRINEEKEALAKLRATTRPDETRIAGDQFSAEEYEQYAEKVIENGEENAVAIARQAMTRARQIRQEAFKEKWQSSIREAIDEEPELGNAESDLAKTVNEILRDPNWSGFKSAVKLAKARKLESSVPGLMGEIENYKKEIERLNKAMEVGGKPGMPKRDGPKKFEDMNIKEQAEYLRRRASEADESY